MTGTIKFLSWLQAEKEITADQYAGLPDSYRFELMGEWERL